MAPSFSARGNDWWIEGVAADGVDGVEVTLADGTVLQTPVHDNTFAIATHQPPRQFRWNGPHGPEVQDFSGLADYWLAHH
jgi:hypothetical protein